MTFRTRSLASLIAWAALSAPHPAKAEASAAELSAAKHAFESALDAQAERRWTDAILRLREAISVKDTPGLRFHLARCETELGHLLEASQEYERALELLRRGPKAPDVQKLLAPAHSALLERLPRLTLEISADVQGVRVSIDNQAYPASEVALGVPLNPGFHELRVQAPGRRVFERALSLKERDRIALPVVLPLIAPADGSSDSLQAAPPPLPLSPSTPPPAAEHSSSSAKLYLIIGESVLTVAGLGVGIGYALARGAASDRIDSAQARIEGAAPDNPAACDMPNSEVLSACSDLNAAVDDHDRAAFVSQIGFVTAGVGAAALLTTWLIYPSPSSSVSGVSVQPVVGLGRLGVSGRF